MPKSCVYATPLLNISKVLCAIYQVIICYIPGQGQKDKLSGNEAQYINFNNRACNDVPRILYSECGTQGTFLT